MNSTEKFLRNCLLKSLAVFLFVIIGLTSHQLLIADLPGMPNFGGFDPAAGYGLPGGDPMDGEGGMDDFFGAMNSPGFQEMVKQAEEMLKNNPDLAKQMDEMARSMGMPGAPGEPLQPVAQKKAIAPEDDSFDYKPTKSKSSSKADEKVDLDKYTGFRRVLMDKDSSLASKNAAFSQLLIAFNKAYEQLKGFGLLTDSTQDHLLVPVREELLKVVHGDLCKVRAAIITISENFSEKAFSGMSVKLYKQLFKILDIVESTLKKIESFAALHGPDNVAQGAMDEPSSKEVEFIDGSGSGTINFIMDEVEENFVEIDKLLSDKKLKAQYEKHLISNGYKTQARRTTPYWPKYGSSSYPSSPYKGRSTPASSYRGGSGYGSGYDPYYDDYYNKNDPYKTGLGKTDSKTPDPKTPEEGAKDPDLPGSESDVSRTYKEPNKEACDIFAQIAGLADLQMFTAGQQSPNIEGVYSEVSKVVRSILAAKTAAQEMDAFLLVICGLGKKPEQPIKGPVKTPLAKPFGQTKVALAPPTAKGAKAQLSSPAPSFDFDPNLTKSYVEQLPDFVTGLSALEFFSNGLLPYSSPTVSFCPGMIDQGAPEQLAAADSVVKFLDASGAATAATPFALTQGGGDKGSVAPSIAVGSFIKLVQGASGQITQLKEVLKAFRKTITDISTQNKSIKMSPSKLSVATGFDALHKKLSAVIQRINQEITTAAFDTSAIASLTAMQIPFFKGLAALTEDQWELFAHSKKVQNILLALCDTVVKYKVRFPYSNFVSLDGSILACLKKVSDVYKKLIEFFEGLNGFDLKEPVAGVPALRVVPCHAFIQSAPGAIEPEKRDTTREFLIAIYGLGKNESNDNEPKSEGYRTLGTIIKSTAILHDNLTQVVTAKPVTDSLHASIVASCGKALTSTVITKTSITDLLSNVRSAIENGVSSAASFISSLF